MAHDIASLIPLFCDAFMGISDFEGGAVAFRGSIAAQKMDYSIESLKHLDAYLDVVWRGQRELSDQDYTNTVLAAGSYLGEVIRRNSERNYRWVNYQDYFPHHPKIAALAPEGLGTAAVLANADGVMTMPINKIVRYLNEGPENNTHFYAQGELKAK